jgi:dipeptidyl aminopeptidase/acylaminoacyl peptidase
MYAAKGYAVAYVNYRGSNGYGIAHSKAVRLDYGGADYQDNIQVLDVVLSQSAWIDDQKLYLTGGSHGGFLTNWITTKTDRFKVAVTQRSISPLLSEAGTQEFTPKQMNAEFGGNLWTNFDYYWDRSPLQFANKKSTPTLIIDSDGDMITPIGQGKEWFYALKANGAPTEMVVFKGENHSLSRSDTPTNLVERLDRILEWFER